MTKIEWERDDTLFIYVDPTCLLLLPYLSLLFISSTVLTINAFKSLTYTPLSLSSWICNFCFLFPESKSTTS